VKIVEGKNVMGLKEKILIYGDPKTGKSRLSLELPQDYFGKIAYCPWDPGSEALASLPLAHRDNVCVVEVDRRDPLESAVEMASYAWEKDGFGTLVWDTLSWTSHELLKFYANTAVFSSKHGVTIGRAGTKSYHTTPMRGDFGAVQNSIGFIVEYLLRQKVHLVVVCHAKMVVPKEDEEDREMRKAGGPNVLQLVEPYAGPDIAGRAAVKWLPGLFDAVFYTQRLSGEKIIINTAPRGLWGAGYRTPEPTQSLPARYDLPEDDMIFWKAYLKSKGVMA
jgi:hypothetical protein